MTAQTAQRRVIAIDNPDTLVPGDVGLVSDQSGKVTALIKDEKGNLASFPGYKSRTEAVDQLSKQGYIDAQMEEQFRADEKARDEKQWELHKRNDEKARDDASRLEEKSRDENRRLDERRRDDKLREEKLRDEQQRNTKSAVENGKSPAAGTEKPSHAPTPPAAEVKSEAVKPAQEKDLNSEYKDWLQRDELDPRKESQQDKSEIAAAKQDLKNAEGQKVSLEAKGPEQPPANRQPPERHRPAPESSEQQTGGRRGDRGIGD